MDPLRKVESQLRAAMDRSPEFKELVRAVGLWLESLAADAPGTPGIPGARPSSEVEAQSPTPPPAPAAEPALPRPTKKTNVLLGGHSIEIEVPIDISIPKEFGRPRVIETEAPAKPEPAAPDLARIALRSRVKADGCRWSVERRRLKAAGADHITQIAPTDRSIVERAKALPSCWVWMVDPNFAPRLPGEPVLETFADLYANLAAAAELVHAVDASTHRQAFIHQAINLLAEAQSALRAAAERWLFIEREADQVETYAWLRDYSQSNRIYIGRFMRLDDPADPDKHAELAGALAEALQRFKAADRDSREHLKLLKKVAYDAKKVAAQQAADDAAADPLQAAELLAGWRKLAASTEQLLELGVLPSDVRLRDALLPAIDAMPEEIEFSPGFERVLTEIDRYLASREAQENVPPPAPRQQSPDVRRAAALLEGKRVVIIGGECRRAAKESLERELRLKELTWISSREHQSIAPFESEVARDDTALVLMAIRWASHSFEGVKDMCERYGKPYVRLPGGYNASQVAHQVLLQASGALAVE